MAPSASGKAGDVAGLEMTHENGEELREGERWLVVTSWPAYFCALANLLAIVAMATMLTPGTTLFPEAWRAAYVAENAALWRVGWSLWIVAAISLLVFYRWWAQRVDTGSAPLWVAAAAFAADMIAESTLIVLVPDRPELARPSFLITGGVANGLYTVAGVLLTRATPGIRGRFALWTWTMWSIGIVLSMVTFLEMPLAIAAVSAALFALFIPWCVAIGRRLA
jgi:hypothetical protein